MEIARLRGHHLGSLCYAFHRTGEFGQYYEQLFGGKQVLITNTIDDDVCRECPARQPYCNDRYRDIDNTLAAIFGLVIGKTYSFDDIKNRLRHANVDDRAMELVLEAQRIR